MKNIIKYYKNELGIDLEDLSHPISKIIKSISENTENEKEIKKHHLRELGLALIEIKNYNKDIYNTYLKRIVNNKDISIHGHIFEIKECAHFIETCKNKKLEFKFGDVSKEEPDFIVNNCGFEITSIRFLDESSETNPGKKLLNKFRNKNSKKYAKLSNALIIDISEATYQTFKKNIPVSISFNEVKELMRKEMKFGVILCFIEWIEVIERNIYFKGIVYPVYSKNCAKELRNIIEYKFLNKRKYPNKIY